MMMMLTMHNDDIFIEGFSRKIYRSEHINNTRKVGLCIYYGEGLPIRCEKDFELLSEIVCVEVCVASKKILFSVLYLGPSQRAEDFDECFSSYKQ